MSHRYYSQARSMRQIRHIGQKEFVGQFTEVKWDLVNRYKPRLYDKIVKPTYNAEQRYFSEYRWKLDNTLNFKSFHCTNRLDFKILRNNTKS